MSVQHKLTWEEVAGTVEKYYRDNLANTGLIKMHDLTNGTVRLNRQMWEQLDDETQRRIMNMLQARQNDADRLYNENPQNSQTRQLIVEEVLV